VLHGPGDLRVEEVPEPAGEVLVRVEAATVCATDRKMLRHRHPALGPYPARFGHETAGVRADTGARVLVGDSVACGACTPCAALRRPQLCEDMAWVLGGFAEAIAAPAAALHAVPAGLDAAGAAMAEPLAAAVHAVARGGDAPAAAVLGGGSMGLMLARLLVLEGREVTLCDRHPERRAQAEALGATAVARLGRHPLVFEAVGRPAAWRTAVDAVAPGGVAVLVGGCAPGAEVRFAAAALHYAEVDVRGAFHHAPAEVDRALELLASGAVDWRAFAGATVGLDGLLDALRAPPGGEARKLVVDPRS
jgi:L-iditol 2-dehydrogenase